MSKDHKGSFHTKNYENLQRRLEDIIKKPSKTAILAKNGQILTIFGHFGGQKFFHLSHMETQLHAKNKKKYHGQGCRTGTHVRTHESEFIGSFRSLKTSGEPIKHCPFHEQRFLQNRKIRCLKTLFGPFGPQNRPNPGV